jgi:FkbM family methyltransferase
VQRSLVKRAWGRLGAPARRLGRRARRARRRLDKRLKRSVLLRDSALAHPLARVRYPLGVYFDDTERLLHALQRDCRDPFFVQVGACEGAIGDPLGYFMRVARWRGILVEPVPYLAERIRANCGDLPNVTLEHAAIAPEEGERVFHYLEPSERGESDLRPEIYKTLGSFRRENLERHAHYIARFEERVVSRPVRCLPLDALCRKHGVTRLDLLFCDAEGYDHEVLKTLDLARTPPRLVVWEHQHLSAEDDAACRRRLEQAGYRLCRLAKDSAALRGDAQDGALGAAFARLGA